MDFRKYDGVVGGVEQGAIQVSKHTAARGHDVVLVCKRRNLEEVTRIFTGVDRLRIVPVDVDSHVISCENARLDSGFFQDLAEREQADLVHFFYNWSFPARKKVPSILTVHDVIPFTFREAMGFFQNRFLYRPAIRRSLAHEYGRFLKNNLNPVRICEYNSVAGGLHSPTGRETLQNERRQPNEGE